MNHFHITTTSLLYTLSALIGLVVSLYAIPHYHFSLFAAKRVVIPKDRVDAIKINRVVLIREYIRLCIHVTSSIVGLTSFLIFPDPVAVTSLFNSLFSKSVIATLLLANFGTTIVTILAWQEYRIVRRRDVPNDVSILADLRTRIGRVERPRIRPPAISRDTMASLKWQMRRLARRVRAEEGRSDDSEAMMSDHEERIEIVEDQVSRRDS